MNSPPVIPQPEPQSDQHTESPLTLVQMLARWGFHKVFGLAVLVGAYLAGARISRGLFGDKPEGTTRALTSAAIVALCVGAGVVFLLACFRGRLSPARRITIGILSSAMFWLGSVQDHAAELNVPRALLECGMYALAIVIAILVFRVDVHLARNRRTAPIQGTRHA